MINNVDILNASILVVDDLETNVQLLELMLVDAGYTRVTSTRDPFSVCDLYRANQYDLILLDLLMPGKDGFKIMAELKPMTIDSYVPVLVVTAQPDQKQRALDAGAKDFVCKPFDMIEILTRIRNMLEVRLLYQQIQKNNLTLEKTVQQRTAELVSINDELLQEIVEHKQTEDSLRTSNAENKKLKDQYQAENIYLHGEIDREFNFGEIIGQSLSLEEVFFKIEQVAMQDATVLLLGETGTGKGVVTRAIHSRSSRKERPMITVNCSALPANLIESELFGREKGAFTGSHERQIGRFELADNSTLFLDEIGDMPMDLQSKLLRVIQDGEFERLGSPKSIKVDVRIIAATNRDLKHEIKEGRFREDLYYRLNVFPITVPPLRQRIDDIPLLVNHFVSKFNTKINKQINCVSKATLELLQAYHWPGNVRELESVIERAVITSQGNNLQVLDRFDHMDKNQQVVETDVQALADLEHNHIQKVLLKTNWRIEGKKGAAILLKLNPSTLRARMRKYGIFRQ